MVENPNRPIKKMTWEMFDQACKTLSEVIKVKFPNIKYIYGVPRGGLISLHNLYQTLMFVKESQTKELNINIKYKKFIDVMHEHGPDKAFQILDTLYETNTQQQSLFSY